MNKYKASKMNCITIREGEIQYSSLILKYVYPKYKNKPSFTQYYKVDTTKEIKIGGRSEIGHELNFINGTKSNTVITKNNLNKLLSGNSIELNKANVTIYL